MDLAGTVSLVAGGASGLGRATGHALSDAGASVVVLDLARPSGEGEIMFVPGDVREEVDVRHALDVASGLGPLRICLNCAGIGAPARIACKGAPASLEAFRKIIDVNLVGTYNVTRLAAARMQLASPIADERGVIINTASVAAFEGHIGQVSYSASKGAIAAMTLPVARDLADSLIRCVTIAPGHRRHSALGRAVQMTSGRSLARSGPHPARLGRPEEFASLVLHVVENQMVNGEIIRLDGALRMAPR